MTSKIVSLLFYRPDIESTALAKHNPDFDYVRWRKVAIKLRGSCNDQLFTHRVYKDTRFSFSTILGSHNRFRSWWKANVDCDYIRGLSGAYPIVVDGSGGYDDFVYNEITLRQSATDAYCRIYYHDLECFVKNNICKSLHINNASLLIDVINARLAIRF